MATVQAPPGWYPDPASQQPRYWDGAQWTQGPPPGAYPGPHQGVPMAPVAVPYGAVQPKNPAISLIVSLFLPGVGSMINGETGKGALILGLYILGVILTLVLVGFLIMLGVWIWGMVDAYQGAVRWNAAHGIQS